MGFGGVRPGEPEARFPRAARRGATDVREGRGVMRPRVEVRRARGWSDDRRRDSPGARAARAAYPRPRKAARNLGGSETGRPTVL